MPTKQFTIKQNLGPLLQNILYTNKEVESASYIRPNLTINDTIIEIRTKKVDPKVVLEETLFLYIEKYQGLKIKENKEIKDVEEEIEDE